MFRRFKEVFKSNRSLQLIIIVLLAILFYTLINNLAVVGAALKFVFGILAPVITAAIIAFLLYPVIGTIEKKVFKKLRARRHLHAFCVIFTVLVICVFLLALVVLVITQGAESLKHLLNNFNVYVQKFTNMLNSWLGDRAKDISIFGVNIIEIESVGLQNLATSVISWCTEHAEGIIGGAQSVGSNVFNIFLTVMLTIYMLLDADHLKKSTSRYFRSVMAPEKYVRFSEICSRSSRIFTRYFLSNVLDSLIIGIACYIFMLIMGLPYSLIISVVVGVTNFVPTFGPLVGGIIGAFLILLIDPMGAVWFIIYELVSQFCDANLIKPKLFGDTTGLRPMWVLAAIIIGGGLFGVVGMLLGVPLVAILAMIMNERVEKRLQHLDKAAEGENGEASQ
ncbi:MAG: AI-2E family transporter [Parasporobacterium sp.]|nr:AI-2E family transporter [Parasporobacterium sp.]